MYLFLGKRKEYGKADARWLNFDPAIVSVENSDGRPGWVSGSGPHLCHCQREALSVSALPSPARRGEASTIPMPQCHVAWMTTTVVCWTESRVESHFDVV